MNWRFCLVWFIHHLPFLSHIPLSYKFDGKAGKRSMVVGVDNSRGKDKTARVTMEVMNGKYIVRRVEYLD